jgi:hypothetical protein
LVKEWIAKTNGKENTYLFDCYNRVSSLGLFLAPGPKIRAMSTALTSYNELSLFGKLKFTFPAIIDFFIYQQAIFTILITILLSILCYQKSTKWYWLICGPIVLLPFIFQVPMFGQKNLVGNFLEHKRHHT